jgi:hypothetical protein
MGTTRSLRQYPSSRGNRLRSIRSLVAAPEDTVAVSLPVGLEMQS